MEPKNNDLIPQSISEPKTQIPSEGFDFMSAYLDGVTPADIWKAADYGLQKTGKPVDILPPDFEKFKQLRPDLQGDDAVNTFKDIQGVYREYKNMEFNVFDSNVASLPNTPFLRKLTGGVGLMPSTEKYSRRKVTGYMDTYGGPVQINTDQEIGMAQSVFKAKDGYWKPTSEMKNGSGYFELQEGKEGEPDYFWKEKEEFEYINPEKLLSNYGPTTVNSNIFASMGRGVIGGIAMMFTGIGQLIDITGDLIKPIFYDKETYNDPDNAYMWMSDRVGTHMTNWGNTATHQNEDEKRGMFDNWNGAFYSVFNGVGQIAPIILTSGITFAGVKGVGTAGARLLGKEALTGLEAGITAAKITNAATKSAYQAGLLMGSFESMGAYRQQMKNMGVDDFTSAKWAVPFSMATYLSEQVLGENVLASFYGRNLAGGIRKEVEAATKSLNKTILKQTGKTLTDLPEETQKQYVKGLWKSIMDKRQKLTNWTKNSKAGEVLGGATQEALEENPIEPAMDYAIESLYNTITVGQSNNILQHIGGNTYTKEPGVYEGINPQTGETIRVEKGDVYYRTTPSGKKEAIDKQLWEAEQQDIANAKRVIKNGEMLFENPADNFSLDQPLSAFISTLMTLGLGSAVTSTGLFNSDKAKKEKGQSDNISNLAYKSIMDPKKFNRGMVEAELNNIQKEKKVFGREFVTMDNDVLLPNDSRPSEAQSRIKLIMDEFDLKVNAIKTYGLASPAAATAMAGDNELINKATEIATKIMTLEEQRAEAEQDATKGNVVELDKEIGGLKAELNDYITPKDGKGQKSKAYTNKTIKVEAFKYFMEKDAQTSATNQLQDKKDKLTDAEYKVEYDKAYNEALKTYVRNADTIALKFGHEYDAFFNHYVKNFEQKSKIFSDLINEKIKAETQQYNEHENLEQLTAEKIQSVKDLINNIPDVSKGDISGVTTEVQIHFDNVKGVINDLRNIVRTGKVKEPVINDINNLVNQFTGIINQYAVTKDEKEQESGGLSDIITDQIVTNGKIDSSLKEDELINLGLHVGTIQKEFSTPQQDKMLYDVLINELLDKPIILRDKSGQQVNVGTWKDVISKYVQLVNAKEEIPLPEEAMMQMKFVENYLKDIDNYVDLNRNFFQKVIEANPEKNEHSYLNTFPNVRISEKNEQELAKTISKFNTDITSINDALGRTVYARDLEQTQKKIQLLDLRYTNLLFYRDTIKTELTKEQGTWMVEIDEALTPFKGVSENRLKNLYDLYKKEVGEGNPNSDNLAMLKLAITNIERLIVNIENDFSGRLDSTLDWIKENWTNPEYLFNKKASNYTTIDEFYLQMPYFDGTYGGLISQDGYNYADKEIGYYFRAYWLATWTSRLNSMGQVGKPSMKQIYNAYLETERERKNTYLNVSNFEQEFGMLHLVSHFFDSKLQFLDDLTKGKNDKPSVNYDKFIPGSLRLAGFAGAGKTTQVLRTAIPTLFKLNGGKNIKVAIINPTESNQLNHEKNEEEVFSGKTTISYYQLKDIVDGSKQIDSNTDLVIIDEGSVISEVGLKGGEVNGKKLKGLKASLPKDKAVWILADDTQPASVDENGKPYSFQTLPVSYTGERTLPITEIHRTGIAAFHTIANHFREFKFSKDIGKLLDLPFVSYAVIDGKNVGAKYRTKAEDVLGSFLQYMEDHNGASIKDVMLIVDSENTKSKIIEQHPELNLGDNIRTLSYNIYDSGGFAGGLDSKNVYFAVNLNDFNINNSNSDAMNISRYGVVGVGRARVYLEMVGPVSKSTEGTVIGADEALGKSSTVDLNVKRNKDRNSNIERLEFIIGDIQQQQQQSGTVFDRSTTIYDESKIVLNKKQKDLFVSKDVDENDLNSVSNIIFDTLPQTQKGDVNLDTKQRNEILRYAVEYEFANSEQRLVIDKKIKDKLKLYLQKNTDDEVLGFQISIQRSVNKNMFRDIFGNAKNTFLFKNISFNKVNGIPFLVKVVGMNQGAPVVDIYDIAFKKDDQGMSIVSDYNKGKLGLYASIMMANGFMVNNLHMVNLQNVVMGRGATPVLLSKVVTLEDNEFEEGVVKGNEILGQVSIKRPSQEEFYINDRIVDHPTIKVGDTYLDDKGEVLSVNEVTTVFDKKLGFINHVWFNGNDKPITDAEFLKSFKQPVTEYDEKEKYKSTAESFADGKILGTSSVFYGFKATDKNHFIGNDNVTPTTTIPDDILYDITKNKWLKTKHKVLDLVLGKTVNKVYHNELTDYNGNKYKHVVTTELTDDAIDNLLLTSPDIMADLGVVTNNNIESVYHHTKVTPDKFDFGSFKRQNQVSQFGNGLNASTVTNEFFKNRYGNPIEGEVKRGDFIEIDSNKNQKEIYEELKSKGFKFKGHKNVNADKWYNGNESLNQQPGDAIELFNDFQESNPSVKGVRILNHIIGEQKVEPFYVIYDSKSFYGKGSIDKGLSKEESISRFKSVGLHILSNEYRPEYDFATLNDNKQITDTELEEYASMPDQQFEERLDARMQFTEDVYEEQLKDTNKYRVRIIRKGIQEFAKTGKSAVVSTTKVSAINNGVVRISKYAKGDTNYKKVIDVASEEKLSAQGIQRSKDGFKLVITNAQTGIKKFVLPITRGVTPMAQVIATSSLIDDDYLMAIKEESNLEKDEEIKKELKVLSELQENGYQGINRSNIDDAKKDLSLIIDSLGLIKFAEANANFLHKTNDRVFNEFFEQVGTRYRLKGNLIDKRSVAISFLNTVINERQAYNSTPGSTRETMYGWTQHLYKHAFEGTSAEKGDIIEENLVTRFEGLNQKGIITNIDPEFAKSTIQTPKTNQSNSSANRLANKRGKLNKVLSSSTESLTWIEQNNTKEQIRAMIGDHVDNHLWINEGFIEDGDKVLLGRVKDGLIMLSTYNGKIEQYTPRHELAHWIMLYMIKPEQSSKIIDSAKNRMKKEGIINPDITEIYEYIADLFEGKKYLATNQKNTLLNRFIDFMRRLLSRIKVFGSDLNNFMYSVDRGYYVDKAIMNLESNEVFDKAIDNVYFKTETLDKLLDVFGSELNIQTVTQNILRPLWKEYSPITLAKNNYVPSLYDSVYYTINDFVEDRKYIDENEITTIVRERNEDGVLKTIYNGPISKMTKELFLKTILDETSKFNRDAYNDYIIYHLGDPQISKALLQQLFPSMDIEKIFDNAVNILVNQLSINGKSWIKADNELSNPTDGRSILLSTMMATIKFRDHKTGNQMGRNLVFEENLSPLLQNAFDKLRSDSLPLTYHNMLNVLYDRLVDRNVEPNEKNVIFSFLSEYGNKESIPVTVGKSANVRYITPKDLRETIDESGKTSTEMIEIDPPIQHILDNEGDFIKNTDVKRFGTPIELIEDEKIVNMKLDQYQKMVNAIYSYYSSNKTSYVTTDDYSTKTGLTTTNFEGNNVSIAKNDMKDQIAHTLTFEGQIKQRVYNAIRGENRKYTVNEKGITYRNGDPIITRTIAPNGVVSYNATSAELHLLANNFLGIYKLSVDIIDTMDINELSKLLYMMMMSIKVTTGMEDTFKNMIENLNPDENIEVEEDDIIAKFTSTSQNKAEYDIIKHFYDIKGYKPENVTEREYKRSESGDTISEMRTFMPMDMWKDLSDLSARVSWDTFDMNNTSYRTVDGERAYNITLGSFYSNKWNLGSNNAVVDTLTQLEETQEKVKSPLVSFENGKRVFNNPLLNHLFSFDHIMNYGGVKSDFKSASWMRMSMQDAFMTMIQRTWNSLKTLSSDVAMPTLSSAFADKSFMPIIPVRYSNKNNIIKVSKPRGSRSYNVHTQVHVLNPIIDQINRYYETQRNNALKELQLLLGYNGSVDEMDINAFFSSVDKNGNKLFRARSEMGQAIRRNLINNYHYIYNRDTDTFTAGNAFTDALSPFTQEFSSRWNSTTDMNEKYNILKEKFNDQYIHFVQMIKQSGYVLPQDIKDLFTDYTTKEGIGEDIIITSTKTINAEARQRIGELSDIYGKLLAGQSISQEELNRLATITEKGINDEYMNVLTAITKGNVLTKEQLGKIYGGIKAEKYAIQSDINKQKKALYKNMASNEFFQKNENGELMWHPLLEGIFWNFYVVNESMQQLDRGSRNMFTNVTDFIKRAAGLIAPKTVLNVHDPKGIGRNMRVLVTEDMAMEEVQNELYQGGYKWKIMSDGFSPMNPVSWHLFERSAGGEAGIFTNGAIKPMVYDYNGVSNDLVYLKFSQMPITFEFMSGKYYQDLMAMMLNIVVPETGRTIWDMFKGQLTKSQNSFDTAIKNIVKMVQNNPWMREQMVDFVVPESAYKAGLTGLNVYGRIDENRPSTIDNILINPELNKNAIDVDASKYGIQTYLLQDTDETEKALATQILAIMGLLDNNHEFVQSINEALAGFVGIAVEKLKSLKDPEDIRKFIREISISGAIMQGESVKNATIINNTGFEADVLEDKYFRSIISYLNKYVHPDMPGQTNTQMPCYLYMYEKNGKLYSAKDILVTNEEGETVSLEHDRIDVKGYTRRLLKPETYHYKEGDKFVEFQHKRNEKGEIIETAREQFNKRLKEDPSSIIYRPAEVITSFNYMNKFGLVPSMTMTDATVLHIGERRLNLYDARTNGYKMGYSDFYDILKHEFINLDVADMFSSLNENVAIEIQKRIAGNKNNYRTIAEQYDAEIKEELKKFDAETTYLQTGDSEQDNLNKRQILNAKYDSLVNEYIAKDREIVLSTIAHYYDTFNQALDVYFMKIPTTNASSGGMGRIVAFSPSAKNVFFFSPEQNILSDGDFDADPIQIFFRAMDKQGNVVRKIGTIKEEDGTTSKFNEKKYNQNMIFDALEKFYYNVPNSVQVLAKIDLTTFRQRVNNIKEDLYINNPGSFVKIANHNKQGKRVVGFFANQNTLTVKLRHLLAKVRLNNNIFDESLSIMFDDKQALQAIEFITKLVQGATDNANEGGMLGKLNVNEATSPLINGLTLKGIPRDEFDKKMVNGDNSNQVENNVMDIIQYDPLVRMASNEVLKSFTVTPGKRKYIYDVFNTMLKDFTKSSDKQILKDYGIEITPENKQFYIDKLTEYRKYSLIGEQLRRFSSIPTIQQEFNNSRQEIHQLRVNIEMSIGMSIDDFLKNVNTIKDNKELDIDAQIEWLRNNHMKYSMTPEIEEKERIIRGGFSIAKVVANSPNLIAYVKALQSIPEMADKTFNTTKLEKPLYENVLRVTGRDMLTYPDDWKSLYDLKKDIVNASFLEDRYGKFHLEVAQDVNPFGNKTTFNMGNINDRTEFAMFIPNYVRNLKVKYPTNQFIQKLKYKSTRDGLEYIEFANNMNMTSTEKTVMQDQFAKLPEDVKKIMRMYQFITYGFRYKNGSYTEMTDTVMEKEFSDWVKDFNVDKVIKNIDEILKSAAPVYPDLIGTKDNIANGATIFKGFVKDELDPSMYIYQGTGEFTVDNYKMLTNPAPRWMNSVVMDSSYSTLPVIRGIELEDLIQLREGKPGSIKVRNYRYRMMPKINYDKYIAKQIEQGKVPNKFNLYSGMTAITVDGTYVKVNAGIDKSDILVSPINENGTPIKASAISYNTRKASTDVLSMITDKISTAFPYIKIDYVNNDTSLYPSLLGYIKDGVVYLNTDRMEPGTAFHEIVGHIFVDYLQQNNPNIYNQLRQQAQNLINSPNPDIKRILNNPNYKNLSVEDQVKEVIATIVGWTSEDVIDEHFKAYGVALNPVQKSTLWNTIKEAVMKFYNWMKNSIGRLFGINMSDPMLIERLSSSDLTIEGFARIVTEQVIKQKGPILNYTTGQYGKLTGDQVRKMAQLSSEQIKNTKVKSMDDITNLLKNTTRPTFKQLTDSEKVNALKIAIENNRGFLDRRFTGLDDINFNEIAPELWNDRLAEIARNYTEQNKMIPDNIIKFHNEEHGNLNSSGKIFGNRKDRVRPLYSETSLQRLNAIVGYNPSMKVYKYSWLKSIPKYAYLYDESLVGEDPLVYIQETEDGKTYISLYHVSNESISATPENNRGNLLNFMYTESASSVKGVSADNSFGSIKGMSLAILAQHINTVSDGNTYIEDAGIIQFTPGDTYFKSVDPIGTVNDMRILANEPRFMSMVDNDTMKNIFNLKTLKPFHVNYESLLLSTYSNMEDKPYYMYEYFDKKGDHTIEEMITLFKTRAIELNNGREFSSLSTDEIKEYKMLMKSIFTLDKTPIAVTSLSSNNAITAFNKLLQTGLDYDNEVIKKLREVMLDASNKIVDEFNNDFRKGWFDDTVEYFKKKYPEYGSQYLRENTNKYYDELHVKIKDSKGDLTNTGYIYWTKDVKEDPMFANDAKNVNNEALTHGRKIVKSVTDMYTKLLLHKRHKAGTYSYTEDGGKTWKAYDYERAKWELLNKTAYREGMLPVMDMTVGGLFASGKIGAAWKKKFIQMSDTFVMFDDYAGMNQEEQENMDHLQDMFLHQIGIDNNADNTIYGSKGRLAILGLTQDKDGKWTSDVKKNGDMNRDLETTIAYFMMSGLRTINYEQDVLPVFNAAKMYVMDLENNKKIDQKNVRKLIDLIVEGPIKGKRTITTGDLAGIKLDPAISTFQSMFGTVALFGNVSVGMVSALTNGMKAFIEGVANSMIDRGLPTAKHVVQASSLFFSSYTKATQLAIMFQVCNMSEYELLTSRRHTKGKQTIASEHIGHWFNWSTDMYARSVMMIAQMLKDGSWDAYTYNAATGKVEYDESKDKQWNDRPDEEKGDGKIRKEDVRHMLIKEGTMKPDDKKLTRGYDYKAARKFKALGDKYIVGAYDDKTKAMLGQTLTGRMVGMFHTYLTSMVQNAFQKRGTVDELGKRIVVLDAQGNRVAEWERLYVEGYITTIVRYLKSLYTYLRTGDKEYLKLDKLGQYNMVKVTTMLLTYLFLMGLFKLLVDQKNDPDDDDDPIPEIRLIKNFKYAAFGLFTIPSILAVMERPWAAASMAKRMFQDEYGQMKLDNMVNIIPVYKSTVVPVTEMFDNENEK